MAKTVDLKSLARRVLERGTSRDTVRDGVFRGYFAQVEPARQRPVVSMLGRSAPSFERAIPAGNSEPGLKQPCATRRGRVEELLDSSLLHFCSEYGAWGAFGYGVICARVGLAAGSAPGIDRKAPRHDAPRDHTRRFMAAGNACRDGGSLLRRTKC